jgi:nucleoid-associated protein YgaU
MGVIIPSIPYKSQLDPDAGDFRNDCGPTCLAMILNAAGIEVSTNTVYRKTGADANDYVSVSQLMRVGLSYAVPFDYFYPWNIDRLKQSIDAGKAPITLVHYGAWSQIDPGVSTQNTFTGPHFVVVVAYDDENIYVNDPLWKGDRRSEGEHKRWTYEEFNAAWGSASKDGNRNFSGIVCTKALPTEFFGGTGELEEPVGPPLPPSEVDPVTRRRILAWCAFNKIPIPNLSIPAVATAFNQAIGDWGLRVVVHTVEPTDTIPLIALRYYNDPMKWDVLVYFNGMTFADPIHNGDVLIIPEPMERETIIPEEEKPVGGTGPIEGLRRSRYVPY